MTAGVTDVDHTGDIERMLGRLVEPALADLAAQLRSSTGLSSSERSAVQDATARLLRSVVWRQVSRVVVLELNAARLAGTLTAGDSRARWQEWVDRLSRSGAWDEIAEPYPALLPRLGTIIQNRREAVVALARRFSADRDRLAALTGSDAGELRQVEFGAGDSHDGGHTVSILRCGAGTLVYKPRPVAVDAVLAQVLPGLLPNEPAHTRIRVPAVLRRADQLGEYGWAEHIAHRYCDGDDELRTFYRGLGHWLAVMRLLSGSDLHAENLVACGPVPVVVDCETLFTPHRATKPSGYGEAVDLATDRITRSVLRTGLLPGRSGALGLRGVDASAAGSLPGQQPALQVPVIVDQGMDTARLGSAAATPQPRVNHPSAEPDLGRHWEHVVDGFVRLTGQLHARDRAGQLEPLLSAFADCPVRVVVRDTASYGELTRMLWHPSSLHHPEPAVRRAVELLTLQARRRSGMPDTPAVVEAEVAELLHGDVPTFVTTPRTGELCGPRGTRWGASEDLIASALRRWREADLATDRLVVQAALVGAYLNEGSPPPRGPALAAVRTGDVDRRRRRQAALVMRRVLDTAIRGGDQTVTWVAPTLEPTGWAVRPLRADMYAGGAGVAVLVASYLAEAARGRADDVPGVADLRDALIRTLRLADDQQAADREAAQAAGVRVRPDPPGGYLGLGSRIWGWLLLARLGAVTDGEALRRAEALAELLPESVAADDRHDLLAGAAGAVVPLLRLAGHTGAPRWWQLARDIGHRLCRQAHRSEAGARWPTPMFPQGLGGLSHGVTGIGWALRRLAAVCGDTDFTATADAAFAWEETLYDRRRGGWRDARVPDSAPLAVRWCHGSVGIGAAAADLLARDGGDRWADVLRRAASATWPEGFGANHTLCHGDLGAWEVLHRAWQVGLGPGGVSGEAVAAEVLTNLEEHGPVGGMTRDVFSPGMLAGLGGVAYQLLRMHPDSDLPSMLLPDPGGSNAACA